MGEKLQFTELDQYLFGQGTHYDIYRKLGAHPVKDGDEEGVYFAVWAPNAQGVSVIGEFNEWDEQANPMTKAGPIGVFETFVPGAKIGQLYKFFIIGMNGEHIYKADPYANEAELRPGTASRITDIRDFKWKDGTWMKNRQKFDETKNAMSIYEVHPGSWMKHPATEEDEKGFYNYRELAVKLAQYVKDMKSYIESKDPNRLMSYVSNTLWQTPKDATALGDMIMANDYMGTWHGNKDPRVEIPHFWNEHKEKPIVISEFGLCEPAFAGGDPRRTEIFLEKMKIYRELGVNGIIWFCLNDYRTQMGEEGEGRLRRRVHGSADIYGNPKPSYETVKNECAPLYIKSVAFYDNDRDESKENSKKTSGRSKTQRKLQVVIANKTALPCYEACGYHLTGFNSIGSRICQIELDTLKPGETQTVLLADTKESLSRLVIERPDGNESISYKLNDIIKAMK